MRNERLLIISNNVMSNTRNNGKTIYSYIDSMDPQNVAQLYFHTDRPSIAGYRYFRITDKDILKGILYSRNRGTPIHAVSAKKEQKATSGAKHRGEALRLFREMLWKGKWKSKALLAWLDAFSPTAVFFVGGDCLFAYDICKFIADRYNAKTSLYITDDYIMPGKKDHVITKLRKRWIKKKMQGCLAYAHSFFTVSGMMRKEYREVFGRDSSVIVNLSEPLKMPVEKKPDNVYTIMYAGSLYYGRDEVLGKLSHAIQKYNCTSLKKALLKVYTNSAPDEEQKSKFVVDGASMYCGSLGKEELKRELNLSDILAFVESFDEEFAEKTKYSLSTKVPEYLSVGKPILAIGPTGIGSMEYLADVAVCVNDTSTLDVALTELLISEELQAKVAERCEVKYLNYHSKDKIQREFLEAVLA